MDRHRLAKESRTISEKVGGFKNGARTSNRKGVFMTLCRGKMALFWPFFQVFGLARLNFGRGLG